MGRIAADLLLESISGRPIQTEIIRVQGPLVVRQSTAPLP
jgi:DNA-binding LacI/PurR family transcriptional regulator